MVSINKPKRSTYVPRVTVTYTYTRVSIILYVVFLNNAHSRNAWARNIANAWLPCTNIWETLQRAITLILRCESKIRLYHFLVLTHSVCPYKKYCLKCFPRLQTLYFYLVCNLSDMLFRALNIFFFPILFFKKEPHRKKKCLETTQNSQGHTGSARQKDEFSK